MDSGQKIILIYSISINSVAYLIMCFDKYRSKQKGNRISEKTLFFIAFILGAPGIYAAMNAPFYHKAAKNKFKIGIPIFIIINILSVYIIFNTR